MPKNRNPLKKVVKYSAFVRFCVFNAMPSAQKPIQVNSWHAKVNILKFILTPVSLNKLLNWFKPHLNCFLCIFETFSMYFVQLLFIQSPFSGKILYAQMF